MLEGDKCYENRKSELQVKRNGMGRGVVIVIRFGGGAHWESDIWDKLKDKRASTTWTSGRGA